ncbi:MAG: MaoC family dehydratase N-terminal domain-containing protein [Actinomycetota bacterium]|jgi:acyl dehydratase|nr:MaoC family dehydratase N-terminal domain-containing protein [Actinomycetota bacterium]
MSADPTPEESPPPVDIAQARADWLGVEFDWATFDMVADDMVAWAEACGETDPRFIDPSHPDFQAHPNFTTHCMSGRVLPEGFPQIGGGFGIDGGKTVEVHAPIRSGDTLKAATTIADIFDKTGRSGTMVFIVQRMTFSNERDEKVSTVDWKMIKRA